MFWGWYSFGSGRRGGGCFFLPLLFICGAFFMADNFRAGWLLPLAVIVVVWLAFVMMRNAGGQPRVVGEDWDGEKPKRVFDEKPKRDSEFIYHDDGDVLEVIESPDDDSRRPDDETLL